MLLSHTPEVYHEAAQAGFDLMLSGHTHGGQICLPGGIPVFTASKMPRTFARGSWRYREMVGYTSAGAGTCIADVRLNCPPEVTLQGCSLNGRSSFRSRWMCASFSRTPWAKPRRHGPSSNAQPARQAARPESPRERFFDPGRWSAKASINRAPLRFLRVSLSLPRSPLPRQSQGNRPHFPPRQLFAPHPEATP